MARVKELIVRLGDRVMGFGPSADEREGGCGRPLRAFRFHCPTCLGPYLFGQSPCTTGEQRAACTSLHLKKMHDEAPRA